MKYRYTGTDEKHFPSLGKTLKPEEIIETDEEVNHPELEPVKEGIMQPLDPVGEVVTSGRQGKQW